MAASGRDAGCESRLARHDGGGSQDRGAVEQVPCRARRDDDGERNRLADDGGVGRRLRAVAVAAWLTVSPTTAEVLAAKPPLSPKTAVSAWLPTPSNTMSVA